MDCVKILLPKNDGVQTGAGTRVLTADGAEIEGIFSININIPVDDIVTAKMEVYVSFDEMVAHPLLGWDSLVRAADSYGFRLVPKDGA